MAQFLVDDGSPRCRCCRARKAAAVMIAAAGRGRRGKSVTGRASELIAIAPLDLRAELSEEARRLYG